MNYEELINRFAEASKLEHKDAINIIDAFFAVIKLGMARGEEVKIYKLGGFTPRAIKTKLAKNKENNQIEITPEEVYPHFKFTMVQKKGTKPLIERSKEDPVKKPGGAIISDTSEKFQFIEKFYRKVVIAFVSLLVIFFLGSYAGYKYFKKKVLPEYLYEKGLTYAAIEEMVDSKYDDVISKTEEYSQEISDELDKIREEQKASEKKMVRYLKKKIISMIQPQLKRGKKKAYVKMISYRVKKNDTLWWISKKYLKNPYNWVGIYRTNGKKIKDPDRIYPDQKIFIPVIKEY